MNDLSKEIGYLKGFCDACEFENSSKEKILLVKIVQVLDSMSTKLENISCSHNVLLENVETLEEVLNNYDIPENFLDEKFSDSSSPKEHIDDLNKDWVELKCSNCNKDMFIDESNLYDEKDVICPGCGAIILSNEPKQISCSGDCSCDPSNQCLDCTCNHQKEAEEE